MDLAALISFVISGPVWARCELLWSQHADLAAGYASGHAQMA